MDWLRRPVALERPVASPEPRAMYASPAIASALAPTASGVPSTARHGTPANSSSGSGPSSSGSDTGTPHSAPGLRDALARLPPAGAHVLDLGAVSSVNVEFFNRLHAKLRVLDFEATLADAGLWVPPAKLPPWAAKLPEVLEIDPATRFDLILAWDYANYLGRDRWPFVARELAERLSPRGSLHVLVRAGKEMPPAPARFRIIAKDQLLELPRPEAQGRAPLVPPRFSHAEVERLHPGLAAAKSFLDKHGLHEIVLEHSEELNLPPRPQAQPRVRRS